MKLVIKNTSDGTEKTLNATAGANLMEPLRDAELIEATCGGAASCGTCHVYFTGEWAEKAGERSEDEAYMLEALEDFVEIRAGSRLACQVTVTDMHEGLTLEIAPEA